MESKSNNPHVIPDLREYNAKWNGPADNAKLEFSKIKKKAKQWPKIKIGKIELPKDPSFDKEFYDAIEAQYKESGRTPPVRLRFDNLLLSGYEVYMFCKKHKIKEIPMNQKMPTDKQIREAISHKPAANKQYSVKTTDGRKIYISLGQFKAVQKLKSLCKEYGYTCLISPEQKYTILDNKGNVLIKDFDKPGDAGVAIRRGYYYDK